MRILVPMIVLALLLPQAATAVITFTQLDEDVFLVSHRVKVIGSRGKATKLVYTKAASLCQAAGFSHMKVLEQESEASQQDDAANASLQVKFYFDDADDRIGCDGRVDPQYVKEARAKLAKQGYTTPERPAPMTAAASEASGEPGTGTCTIEQVAAMARAGLSDEKIRAACT